jgi:hypothetical protein
MACHAAIYIVQPRDCSRGHSTSGEKLHARAKPSTAVIGCAVIWKSAERFCLGGSGFQGPCENLSTFVGRNICQQRHLPHLRRLKSSCVVYPVLPHGATRPAIWRAPPALSGDLQIAAYKPQIGNPESRVVTHTHNSIATNPLRRGSGENAGAPEARKNVAQPGRAGNGDNHNSEHRRCDTFRR